MFWEQNTYQLFALELNMLLHYEICMNVLVIPTESYGHLKTPKTAPCPQAIWTPI